MIADPTSKRTVFNADARFTFAAGADGKPGVLRGYALVWNVLSSDRGGFKVRLLPGSATFANPTYALYQHNFDDLLGDTASGTLRVLPADDYGVPVEIDTPDTTLGRDVFELVRSKRVRGMSFGMVGEPVGKYVKAADGQSIFEASAYGVDEVTVTPIPAFTDTRIDASNFARIKGPGFAALTADALRLERLRIGALSLPAVR